MDGEWETRCMAMKQQFSIWRQRGISRHVSSVGTVKCTACGFIIINLFLGGFKRFNYILILYRYKTSMYNKVINNRSS